MAGFFGLFDYSKPGKGVEKGAPQKKSFFVFFEILFRKFWKLIQANLLFILFSIPIVTIGLANGGLTVITRNYVREDHAFLWGDFIEGIKKNWKQLLVSSILQLIVPLLLIFNVSLSLENAAGSKIWYVFAVINSSMLVVAIFMSYYIPYMIVTFKLTLKQIFKNAAIFAFANFLNNVLITLIIALFWIVLVAAAILLMPIGTVVATLIVIFFGFAFTNFATNFIIYPKIKKLMIDPYYEAHPEEEKPFHLTRLEESEDEEEVVFEDMGRMTDFDD